jgi:hypothetical protein
VLVPNLDGHGSGVALREQVPPDARGGFRRFLLGSVDVGELKPFLVRVKLTPSRTSK